MLLFDTDASSPAGYETLARIGRGGMAEVLLAATRSNGVVKLSVLKCLWPELAEDADFIEMFLDEARLSARLSHPNVVHTHGVVQHEGRLAMAMEYLEGQPLTSVLGRLCSSPALALPTRLRIITKVLAGLEYAHTLTDFDGAPLEVVHRDVSPHNVIVTYDGHVKLLDFGVAKMLGANHQTRPGGVKGKLAYLAPEAIRGERVDRRTDVFSAGVMLWEIVAGRRLWGRKSEGVSGAWRLAAGECAPPLPAELELPQALHEICARALALDPAARYQTAAELSEALEGVGVDATDAHARQLGTLIADTFAAERAQRRALIEFHLRPSTTLERGATFDYECFEVSLLGTTAVHERPSIVSEAVPVEPVATAPVTPEAAPRKTKSRTRRAAGVLLGAAAMTAVALVSGVYLGRSAIGFRWPLLASTWTPPASPLAAAPAPLRPTPPPIAVPTAAAPTTTIVETTAPEARESQASLAQERRDHHAREGRRRRARALDLLSDDVLDLDGQPIAPPSGSSVARSLGD